MRRRSFLLSLSLALSCLSLTLGASFSAEAKTKKAKASDDRSYTLSKLPSGLELIAIEQHKVPLVTIVLAVKAGAMTETPQTNGLTHLWEHMFFKGNQRLPNQEAFKKRIRQLGIEYNGDTSAEKVRYYFTLPSAYLDEGLQFMADAIATPLLEQSELEKERLVVLNEYERNAAQPSFDLNNLERELMYGSQAYQRDALGTRPIIEQATREQLYKIKDEVFVPSNSALLVAGDFDANKLRLLVDKHFSTWRDPKAWKPVQRPAFPAFSTTSSFIMTRPNVEQATVKFTFEGPKARRQPQDSFAADVLISLLQHRSGKFYKKFIDSGLTYGAGLSYYTQSQAGELTLYAMTEPENALKVQKLLMEEVPLWRKPGYFTKLQLEDVRRNLTITRKRELNQPSEYIKSLAFWWAVTGLNYYDDYLNNLSRTGFKEVQAFVQKWMTDKPYIASVFLSPENAKKAGLKDNSEPLVDKYLAAYRNPNKTPESKTSTK